MNNDKKEMTRCGRGISIIVVIIFLFGTLLPLFGNTAQAVEIEETATDGSITTVIIDQSNNPQNPTTDDSNGNNILDASIGNEPLALPTKVYGTVKYKDRDTTGNETPDSPLPLRYAMVKIFQYYDPGEIHIGTTYTTETGYFYYYFTPYPPGYEHQYFARVYSNSDYAEVKDSGVYTSDSDIITIPAVSSGKQYPIPFSSYPDHQAWNILDSITEEVEWIKERTNGWTRSKIDVYYPRGASEFLYHPLFTWIEWINIDVNDGWDDDTIQHEYAHAIMFHLYGNALPPAESDHKIPDEHYETHAFCEGWTPFMDCAIDNDATDVSYTDRIVIDGISHRDNLEMNRWEKYNTHSEMPGGTIEDDFDGDIIEGCVASIFWDIYDDETALDIIPIGVTQPVQDGKDFVNRGDADWTPFKEPTFEDGLQLGFDEIWDVLSNYIIFDPIGQPIPPYLRHVYTIHEFWDGWFAQGYASTNYDKHWIKAIYYNHGIKKDTGTNALPETAPAPNLYMDIVYPNGAYSGTIALYATYVTDLDAEDVDFLRCRFECYEDLNGNGITDDDPNGDFLENRNDWVLIDETTNSDYDRLAYWDSTLRPDGTPLPDGQYLLRAVVDDDMIEAYDYYLNNPITVDNTAPGVPTISSTTHNEGQWSNNGDPSFDWTPVADVSGVTYYYEWDHSSTTDPDLGSPSTTSTSKSYSNQADGTWYFHIRVKDGAGNWGSTDHFGPVCIDAVGPSCSVSHIQVTRYYYIDGTDIHYNPNADNDFRIEIAASDAGTGLNRAEGTAAFGDTPQDTTPSATTPQFQLFYWYDASTETAYDGTVTITVYDDLGNSNTCTVTFIPDVTPPTVTLLINSDASYTESTAVTLNINAQATPPTTVEYMRFGNYPSKSTTTSCNYQSAHPYVANTDQTWTIYGTGKRQFHFVEIDLATSNPEFQDYVKLWDDYGHQITYYGYHDGITTPWFKDTVYVKLRSDAAVQGWGFQINQYTTSWWTDWEPYASTKSWTLIGGSGGGRTVYCEIKDNLGQIASDNDWIYYYVPTLSAESYTSTTVFVGWPWCPYPSFIKYVLYRSTSSPFTPSASNQIFTTTTAETASFCDSGLVPSTTYYYKLSVTYGGGTIWRSDSAYTAPATGCFVEGTKIATPDAEMNIEDIAVGDTVLSYNEQTGMIEPNNVLRTLAHGTPEEYLLINDLLKVTGNHLIYVNDEIMRADTIRLGDILTTLDGDVVVTSIERITQAQKVYNIEVENNHNYFAEGILVHNVLKPEEPYCPFVYTWNGAEYVDDNNILPASTDPERSELDVTDYYRLTNCLVPKDGNYTLLLLENRTEMVYFDQLELMVIDHPEDHEVAMTSEGELVTFSDPISPIFCEDTFGNDVLYQIIGDGDGQYFEGTGGDHLTLTFENMDDITEAKLVVRQKMLPPPEPYDQITAYDPMKCSIHVQTFDESGEWIDLGLIPGRMNWAMSAVSLASVIDYIKNGGEIRLSITGEHLIDFVGLDISEPQPMDVNVYSPIYANYQQSEEVNLVSRLLQKDQWYMAVTSGQDIQVTFPYEPLTDECRDIVLVTTGHYYTASLMTIAQTVKITASVDGGDSGKVTLWLAEEVDRHTTSKVLGQTLNLQEGPENDIRLEFRQIPEMHYSLIAEFENCTDEVTVLVELVSSHGSEILKFDYTPTGSQYDEQSYPLDETFWKITGVSFDPFSGRLLALKNTTLQFSLSEFYLRIENWTDALWDFGDGLSTVEMLPSHEYSSPGTYLLNLTLHNETLNATLITWTKIDIVVSPPEPVLDIYQEVDMTLRVTGRKGNTVTLQIYEDGTLISEIAVARTPGPPNTHTACIHKYLGRDYTIMLIYDAPSGDENPTWLTFNSGDNKEIFFIEFDSNNGIHQEVMVDPELLETVVQGNRQFYFDASGSYDIDGEIVSYDWEFGDDCIETGELVEHTFADAETYTVTLTVTDDDGSIATIAREVVVS